VDPAVVQQMTNLLLYGSTEGNTNAEGINAACNTTGDRHDADMKFHMNPAEIAELVVTDNAIVDDDSVEAGENAGGNAGENSVENSGEIISRKFLGGNFWAGDDAGVDAGGSNYSAAGDDAGVESILDAGGSNYSVKSSIGENSCENGDEDSDNDRFRGDLIQSHKKTYGNVQKNHGILNRSRTNSDINTCLGSPRTINYQISDITSLGSELSPSLTCYRSSDSDPSDDSASGRDNSDSDDSDDSDDSSGSSDDNSNSDADDSDSFLGSSDSNPENPEIPVADPSAADPSAADPSLPDSDSENAQPENDHSDINNEHSKNDHSETHSEIRLADLATTSNTSTEINALNVTSSDVSSSNVTSSNVASNARPDSNTDRSNIDRSNTFVSARSNVDRSKFRLQCALTHDDRDDELVDERCVSYEWMCQMDGGMGAGEGMSTKS
jgi:dentin sialophosphoprotein